MRRIHMIFIEYVHIKIYATSHPLKYKKAKVYQQFLIYFGSKIHWEQRASKR